MLILSTNKINRIASGIGAKFPNLEWLILTNNSFSELSQLDALVSFTNLRCLSLVDNTVAKQPNYRLYVLGLLPSLKVLDYQKVKEKVCFPCRGEKGARGYSWRTLTRCLAPCGRK